MQSPLFHVVRLYVPHHDHWVIECFSDKAFAEQVDGERYQPLGQFTDKAEAMEFTRSLRCDALEYDYTHAYITDFWYPKKNKVVPIAEAVRLVTDAPHPVFIISGLYNEDARDFWSVVQFKLHGSKTFDYQVMKYSSWNTFEVISSQLSVYTCREVARFESAAIAFEFADNLQTGNFYHNYKSVRLCCDVSGEEESVSPDMAYDMHIEYPASSYVIRAVSLGCPY